MLTPWNTASGVMCSNGNWPINCGWSFVDPQQQVIQLWVIALQHPLMWIQWHSVVVRGRPSCWRCRCSDWMILIFVSGCLPSRMTRCWLWYCNLEFCSWPPTQSKSEMDKSRKGCICLESLDFKACPLWYLDSVGCCKVQHLNSESARSLGRSKGFSCCEMDSDGWTLETGRARMLIQWDGRLDWKDGYVVADLQKDC